MMSCRSVLTFCCLLFSLVIIIVLIRTFTFSVRNDTVKDCAPSDVDYIRATDQIINNFRRALQIQTVSKDRHEYNRSELLKLQQLIKTGDKLVMH